MSPSFLSTLWQFTRLEIGWKNRGVLRALAEFLTFASLFFACLPSHEQCKTVSLFWVMSTWYPVRKSRCYSELQCVRVPNEQRAVSMSEAPLSLPQGRSPGYRSGFMVLRKTELFEMSPAPPERWCAFVSQELKHPLESEISCETWLLNAVKPNKPQALCALRFIWGRNEQGRCTYSLGQVCQILSLFGLWSSDILPLTVLPARYEFEE